MPSIDPKSTRTAGATINLPRYGKSLLHWFGFNQFRHQAASYPGRCLALSCCAVVIGLLAQRNHQKQVACGVLTVAAYQITALLFEFSRLLPFDFRSTQNVRQFEEGEVIDPQSGQLLARLKYESNCPVLYILTTDPFKQGRATALATYKQNVVAFMKFYRQASTLLKINYNIQRILQGKWPHSSAYFENYEAQQRRMIALTPRLQREIDGFVEGYNQMLHRHGWPYFFQPPLLTSGEIEHLICVPDFYKLLACSIAATPTETIRLFDFEMLGSLERKGAYMVVRPTVHTETHQPHWTMSFTFVPSFIRVSLINDHHLAIFINETTNMSNKRHNPGGMAELALAHAIAENCCTVDEALTFIAANPAATSHLLTILDPTNRVCVQLLPLNSSDHFNLVGLGKAQLPVTNHMLDGDGRRMPETDSWITSLARYTLIEKAFRAGTSMQDLARALSVPQTAHMLHLTYSGQPAVSVRGTDSAPAHEEDNPNASTPASLFVEYHWGGRHYANRSTAEIRPAAIFAQGAAMMPR